jgi:hypothetical protein
MLYVEHQKCAKLHHQSSQTVCANGTSEDLPMRFTPYRAAIRSTSTLFTSTNYRYLVHWAVHHCEQNLDALTPA